MTQQPGMITIELSYICFIITVVLCGFLANPSLAQIQADNELNSKIKQVSDSVLQAFKDKDGRILASFAHPTKGIRFSPAAFVNTEEDIVMTRGQIFELWGDSTTYRWGYYEGTGDPIELTPNNYIDIFVLDKDYSKDSIIKFNSDQTLGTTQNNAQEAYPDSVRIEYYFPPTSETSLDWAALRLVFEQLEGAWYLVGVIHDKWSP